MIRTLDHIELPPEEGTFSFWFKYDGEPAFGIVIENLPNPGGFDPREVDVAKLTVTTMPILGGESDHASVTLRMMGS